MPPPEIVAALAKASLDILNEKPVREQLQTNGFEVLARGPDGMKRRIDVEVPKWRDLVAKAGITPV